MLTKYQIASLVCPGRIKWAIALAVISLFLLCAVLFVLVGLLGREKAWLLLPVFIPVIIALEQVRREYDYRSDKTMRVDELGLPIEPSAWPTRFWLKVMLMSVPTYDQLVADKRDSLTVKVRVGLSDAYAKDEEEFRSNSDKFLHSVNLLSEKTSGVLIPRTVLTPEQLSDMNASMFGGYGLTWDILNHVKNTCLLRDKLAERIITLKEVIQQLS